MNPPAPGIACNDNYWYHTHTIIFAFQFNHAIHMVKGQRLGIEKIENFSRSDDIKKVSLIN